MPNQTQAQVIQNLNTLQFKIEHDARTRADFLRDPAAALAGTGLVLSPERTRALNGFVSKQLSTPGAMVSGAAIKLTGAGDVSEINLVIAIKV
jgi:cytochrome c2